MVNGVIFMNDPLNNIGIRISDINKQMRNTQEQIVRSKQEEIERQRRSVELLELNANQNGQIIKLKETELQFLKNINEDTTKFVNILYNLEQINKTNGTITEANMLLIQQRLDEMIATAGPANINQLFLDEVKKQIVEKGVGFGIQFIITGLKLLFTADKVS